MQTLFTQDASGSYSPAADDVVVAAALRITSKAVRRYSSPLINPRAVREYLVLLLAGLEYEIFAALFLDVRNRVIKFDELFRGTLAEAAVYPREVVKAALKYNAAAVIFVHNHPSGETTPSYADEAITRRLKAALDLVDVRVLDHLIVGVDHVESFSERGALVAPPSR